MDAQIFKDFWWLIFPVIYMLYGIVRLILRANYRRDKLNLIKAYVDQGKEVPEALIKTINHYDCRN